MTYEVWQGFAQNDAGDVLDTATVTVTLAGTATKPALFSDADGTGSKTNPFNTDASGFVQFYTAPAIVDIVATKGAFSVTFSNVRIGLPDALQTVATLAELQSITPVANHLYTVKDYYSDGSLKSGRSFRYNATGLKSTHNGVTIISPTVPWDGASGAAHTSWTNKVGETDPSGLGVYELVNSDSVYSDDAGNNAAVLYAASLIKKNINFKAKTYNFVDLTLDNNVAADQSTHPSVVRGTGGGGFNGGTKLVANAAGTHVLKCANTSGFSFTDLTLDGAGLVDTVLNLAWVGLSGGVAPANLNTLSHVWVEGVKAGGVGVNLDKFHDSTIDSLTVRGDTGSTTKSVTMNSTGGYQSISNFRLYAGRAEASCQNGQWDRGVVLGGLDLVGASFNNIGFRGVHWIGGVNSSDGTEAYVNSKGTGNSTRHITIEDNYVNPRSANANFAFISGRFWNGATVIGGKMGLKRPVWNITNAAGDGQPAVFEFIGVHFEVEPQWPTNVIIKLKDCTGPSGARANRILTPLVWTKPTGDFDLGATLTKRTDILRYPTTGEWFRWLGSLPKTVGVTTSPGSTGGESSSAWAKVTNDTNTTVIDVPERSVGGSIKTLAQNGQFMERVGDGLMFTAAPSNLAGKAVVRTVSVNSPVINTWYPVNSEEQSPIYTHNGIYEIYVSTKRAGPKGKWTIAKVDFPALSGGAALTADVLAPAGDGTTIELRWQSGVTSIPPEVRITGATVYDLHILIIGVNGGA